MSASSSRLVIGLLFLMATAACTYLTPYKIDIQQGNVVTWASAGTAGFKGSRKSTPYAARVAAQQASDAARESGMQDVDVFVKGMKAKR